MSMNDQLPPTVPNDFAAPPPPEQGPIAFSNEVRLSGREWLGIGIFALAVVFLAPRLWKQAEKFELGPDYRIPFELSNDYWLYDRYARLAAADNDYLVIGDSVIWGPFVTPDQTLVHYLNEQAGKPRFANLGING